MNLLLMMTTMFFASLALFKAIDLATMEVGRRSGWKRPTAVATALLLRTMATIGIIIWLAYGNP